MKKVLLLILFSMIVLGIGAQGYAPKVGETIMFYPLTEQAKQKYLGYDCFYDATKIFSNGEYKFKKGNRYKCNKNGLTPFDEIEGKTFKVIKTENYIHKGKQENKVYLLFLSKVDDGKEIVLRIPFLENNTSVLTKNMIIETNNGNAYKDNHLYVNLPCISEQYMNDVKKKYIGEELFNRENYINNNLGIADYKGQRIRRDNFYEISETLNIDIISNMFDIGNVEKCIDVRFEECNMSIYAHPFAFCTYRYNEECDTVKLPLTYIAGNTPYFNENTWSNNLFENFFGVKKNEIKKIFEREQCLDLIEKYTGKDVYYGLYNHYYYNNEELNSKNNIKIEDGTNYILIVGKTYKCLSFDVFLKVDKIGYDVFAILQDSLGVKFRVPAKMRFSGPDGKQDLLSTKHYNKDFQDYFTLMEETAIQLEQRRILAIQKEEMRKEKERMEKERYDSWVKKYGNSYADYLTGLTYKEMEKFERLAPKYGKATAKLMLEGKVRLGWNKQMCRESWGEPNDINRTTGSWGTHEQWVYGEIYCDYLYFENGILTTIQN